MTTTLPTRHSSRDLSPALRPHATFQPEQAPRGLVTDILAFFSRHWRLMTATFLIVTLFATIIQVMQPKEYTSYASILINPRPQQEVTATTPTSLGTNPDSAFVDSEIEFLNSRFIAGKITDDLELTKDPYWNTALNPPSVLGIVKSLIKAILLPGNDPSLSSNNKELQREKVISSVVDGISASRHGLSYAVRVAVTSHSPRQATTMANAVVEIYRTNNVNSQAQDAERANLWLTDRIGKLEDDIAGKEAAIQEHRRQTGLIETNEELPIERKLRNAETLVLEAQAQLSGKKVLLEQLERQKSAGFSAKTLPAEETTEVIRDLLVQETALKARQATLEQTFGERYSSVVNGRLAINQIRAQIDTEIKRIISGVRLDVAVAEDQLKVFEKQLADAQKEFLGHSNAMDKLRELEREAVSIREAHKRLIERRQNIEGQEQYAAPKMRVLAPAALPTLPSSPKIPLALALALSLGLGTAIMTGLLAEQLNGNKVQSAEQVAALTGYPVIASIPAFAKKGFSKSRDPFKQVTDLSSPDYQRALGLLFQKIRNDCDAKMQAHQTPIISLHAANAGDGKSQTCLALAMMAEQAGLNVLLIECDYQNRGLSKLCSINPTIGLIDILRDKKFLWSHILNFEGHSMDLLPACIQAKEGHSAEIDPASLSGLLDKLAHQYDLIILDSPPVLTTADAIAVARTSDHTYLVVRSDHTKIDAMNGALGPLHHYSQSMGGIVLNGVQPSSNRQMFLGRPREYYDNV